MVFIRRSNKPFPIFASFVHGRIKNKKKIQIRLIGSLATGNWIMLL